MPHTDDFIDQQAIIPIAGAHHDHLTARQAWGWPTDQEISHIRNRDDLTAQIGDAQQPAFDARHPGSAGYRDDFRDIVHGE